MKQWALVLLLFVMFVRGMPEFLGTASANASLTLEATYTSVVNGWVKVERWKDSDPNFLAEDYPPDGRGGSDGTAVDLL